mgnify:CR=1 FL=1
MERKYMNPEDKLMPSEFADPKSVIFVTPHKQDDVLTDRYWRKKNFFKRFFSWFCVGQSHNVGWKW